MSADLPISDFASRVEQFMLDAAGEVLASAERQTLVRSTLAQARAALAPGTALPADLEAWLTDLAQEQLFAHLVQRQAPYVGEVIVARVGEYLTDQEVNSLVQGTLAQAHANIQQFNPARDGAQEWLARLAHEQTVGYLLQQRNPAALLLLDTYLAGLQRSLYQSTFNDFLQPEDRHDILWNTLLRALDQGDRYDPQVAKVATWLNVLLHYETLNFLRVTKHISPTTLDAVAHAKADEVEQHLPAAESQPSREMEELLQRLPAKRAQVIRLFFYDGFSYEAIAQQLGVKEVSVRTNVSRGLKQLREMVNNDERLRQALGKIFSLPLAMLFLVMTTAGALAMVVALAILIVLPSTAHAPEHTPTPASVTATVPPETAVVAQSIQLAPAIDRTRLLQMEADATAVREPTAVPPRATPEMAQTPPAVFTSAEHLEIDAPERAVPTGRLPTPLSPPSIVDAGSTVDNRVVPTPGPIPTPTTRATATMMPMPNDSTATDATALPSPVPSATATAIVPSATAGIPRRPDGAGACN
jgi:RNA polymerase sigma factor (sigma-70 family)